jgi:hypothetical protein
MFDTLHRFSFDTAAGGKSTPVLRSTLDLDSMAYAEVPYCAFIPDENVSNGPASSCDQAREAILESLRSKSILESLRSEYWDN